MDDTPNQSGSPQEAPPRKPKRRRSGLRLAVGLLTGFVLLLAIAAVGAYFWALDIYQRPGPLKEERTVMVARGSGLNQIADNLFYSGVIGSPELFVLAAKIEDKAGALKAGEYAFPAGISMQAALAMLVEGKIVQHRLTIPEGLTSWDIVQLVNEAAVLTGEPVTAIPGEGTLLPDTYFYERGETRQQLLDRMHEAQQGTLSELWPTRQEELPFETRKSGSPLPPSSRKRPVSPVSAGSSPASSSTA